MSAHTNTLPRILEFLKANPGSTPESIGQAVPDVKWDSVRALLSDAVWRNRLWRCGIRHHFIYFADPEQAKAAEPAHMESIFAMGRERLRRKWQKNHANRMAKAGKVAWKAIGKRYIVMPMYAALDTEILRLAGENADGFRCAAMRIADREFSEKVVGNRVVKLRALGLLFAGKLSHRNVRYFRAQADADAWVHRNCSAVDAPVKVKRLPADPDAPIIIPPHVKVQRIPHAPGRFEVQVPKNRGQITADWMLARQGVDVRAVLALT